MDRFFLRISMGYPTLEEEMAVLERFSGTVKPQESLTAVCSAREVIELQDMIGYSNHTLDIFRKESIC